MIVRLRQPPQPPARRPARPRGSRRPADRIPPPRSGSRRRDRRNAGQVASAARDQPRATGRRTGPCRISISLTPSRVRRSRRPSRRRSARQAGSGPSPSGRRVGPAVDRHPEPSTHPADHAATPPAATPRAGTSPPAAWSSPPASIQVYGSTPSADAASRIGLGDLETRLRRTSMPTLLASATWPRSASSPSETSIIDVAPRAAAAGPAGVRHRGPPVRLDQHLRRAEAPGQHRVARRRATRSGRPSPPRRPAGRRTAAPASRPSRSPSAVTAMVSVGLDVMSPPTTAAPTVPPRRPVRRPAARPSAASRSDGMHSATSSAVGAAAHRGDVGEVGRGRPVADLVGAEPSPAGSAGPRPARRWRPPPARRAAATTAASSPGPSSVVGAVPSRAVTRAISPNSPAAAQSHPSPSRTRVPRSLVSHPHMHGAGVPRCSASELSRNLPAVPRGGCRKERCVVVQAYILIQTEVGKARDVATAIRGHLRGGPGRRGHRPVRRRRAHRGPQRRRTRQDDRQQGAARARASPVPSPARWCTCRRCPRHPSAGRPPVRQPLVAIPVALLCGAAQLLGAGRLRPF